jgi:hypothetical protein
MPFTPPAPHPPESPVEGRINRLKMLGRSMGGRAKHGLPTHPDTLENAQLTLLPAAVGVALVLAWN